MSDYTEHGSIPVEDAAVDDPPTVEAVAAKQRRDFPTQVVEKGQVVDDVTDTAFEHRSSQPTVSFESARVTCLDAAAAAQMIKKNFIDIPDEEWLDLDATGSHV